jgi:hypothetical protein
MNFEMLGPAAKKPEWMGWQVEGTAEGTKYLISPEGVQYELGADESFVLVPDKPTDGQEPEPCVKQAGGMIVPLGQWAEGKDSSH